MKNVLNDVEKAIDKGTDKFTFEAHVEEVGRIKSVGQGIVWAEGLGEVKSEELVFLNGDIQGMVLDLLPERIGIVVFGPSEELNAGEEVTRSGRVLDIPVGQNFLGRVIDPPRKSPGRS